MLAHAGFSAVRSMESRATFGFDVAEAENQANQIRSPGGAEEVDRALQILRDAKQRRSFGLASTGLGAESTLPSDEQGETQIEFDAAAMSAMLQVASLHGLPLLGEEDEYRASGTNAAKLRGSRIRSLMEHDLPFAITDPLDGSNQAAGMSQRSGWGACAMVRTPGSPLLTAAVILGDGRAYMSGDGGVWMSEARDPDRTPLSYFVVPRLQDPGFERPHYILPSSKSSLVTRTREIMDRSSDIKWISPLGGNPGILAGMLGGQAVAAMQPSAYAWDHMAALILAGAGFVVLSDDSEDRLDVEGVSNTLLLDLAQGRRTRSMYIGRTEEFAERIKSAAAKSEEV